jgi:hypothetical protein
MARLADLVHVMGTLLQALKAFVDGGVDDLLFRQVSKTARSYRYI